MSRKTRDKCDKQEEVAKVEEIAWLITRNTYYYYLHSLFVTFSEHAMK